jgi:hypothetical protein
MRELKPEPELLALLESFRHSGGVIHYLQFEPESAEMSLSAENRHRSAALAGMVAIERQWKEQDSTFRLRLDEAKLAGQRIRWRTFWGGCAEAQLPVGSHARSMSELKSYQRAFFAPPYGRKGSPQELTENFIAINRHLGISPGAQVWSWSKNWSNFFDAGNEWWGAFYWTLRRPGSQRYTVVCASTTD